MNTPLMLKSPEDIKREAELIKFSETYIRRMNNKKMDIIEEKLKALGKKNILKDLDKKRFKKLMVEMHPGGKEVVWIDNGTYTGLRLVTFINPQDHEIIHEEFRFSLKYY